MPGDLKATLRLTAGVAGECGGCGVNRVLLPADEKAHQKSSEADEQPASKNDCNKQQGKDGVAVPQPIYEPEPDRPEHKICNETPEAVEVRCLLILVFVLIAGHKRTFSVGYARV